MFNIFTIKDGHSYDSRFKMNILKAVFWDVDGTIADTELGGHRIAFNRAFSDYDLDFNGDLISDFLYFTSPGNLLIFLIFLQNNKIPLSKDILSIIFNLIDYLKIQKNSEGLYYLSLLVEKFYNEQLLLNAKNSYIYFLNYHKILNQLNDMKKFNLDVKNILLSIQHTLKNEK